MGSTPAWRAAFSPAATAARYPYITQHARSAALFGGFDKASMKAYLVGRSGGRWTDYSALLGPDAEVVTLLAVDRAGGNLVGYKDGERYRLAYLEIGEEPPSVRRSRSVRH